jgi:FdhD protein
LNDERSIIRYTSGHPAETVTDTLAGEEPLEIRVRGRAVSITMRTPGHDEELAVGPCGRNEFGNLINVQLAPDVNVDFEKLTRHVFGSSSCGLCGKATIDAVRAQFPKVAGGLVISAEIVLQLPVKMRAAQSTFTLTGGLHAAALFSSAGELLVLREDVGRHNAVDKVLGYALLNNLMPLDKHILLVSGRASFEILQKALAGRLPIVAAVSAPSTLAADFARESNQTLIGFLRDNRMNVYSHPQRIQLCS